MYRIMGHNWRFATLLVALTVWLSISSILNAADGRVIYFINFVAEGGYAHLQAGDYVRIYSTKVIDGKMVTQVAVDVAVTLSAKNEGRRWYVAVLVTPQELSRLSSDRTAKFDISRLRNDKAAKLLSKERAK